MLKLYIVRHGETVWNTEKRMQGWSDSDLTEKGIKDAKALGKYLEDVEFKAIYSSSSNRTVHTAELVRGKREQKIITDDNLREIGLGIWEGKQAQELEKEYPKEHYDFWNAPQLYTPISGESFYDIRARIEAVLKRIIAENKEGNILIITHSVVIKSILLYFKDLPIEKVWEPPFLYGTSLTMINVENENAVIESVGELLHIINDTI